MATKCILRMISMIIVIGTVFFTSTEGAPPIAAGLVDTNDISFQMSNGRSELVKLIRKPRSSDLEDEAEDQAEDDLETAAGTNLMRPLFVYRQQMESRARQNRKAVDRRHALFY